MTLFRPDSARASGPRRRSAAGPGPARAVARPVDRGAGEPAPAGHARRADPRDDRPAHRRPAGALLHRLHDRRRRRPADAGDPRRPRRRRPASQPDRPGRRPRRRLRARQLAFRQLRSRSGRVVDVRDGRGRGAARRRRRRAAPPAVAGHRRRLPQGARHVREEAGRAAEPGQPRSRARLVARDAADDAPAGRRARRRRPTPGSSTCARCPRAGQARADALRGVGSR